MVALALAALAAVAVGAMAQDPTAEKMAQLARMLEEAKAQLKAQRDENSRLKTKLDLSNDLDHLILARGVVEGFEAPNVTNDTALPTPAPTVPPPTPAPTDQRKWPSQMPTISPTVEPSVAPTPSPPDSKEGDQLREQMCQAVLANQQQVLPIPWDIIEDRDFAAETPFQPLLPFAEAEAVPESLATHREVTTGLSPEIVLASVKMKDSEQPVTPPSNWRMGGKSAEEILHLNGVTNPTEELTRLQWQKIKWAATKKHLETWKDRYGKKLMILHSYGDMLYGGCNESTIKKKYLNIINSVSDGNPTVVAAAEVSPFPVSMGWRYGRTEGIAERRASSLRALGIEDTWEAKYANCTTNSSGRCNATPTYQFLNSAFLMGPAEDLLELFNDFTKYTGPENQFVSEYYLKNPGKVVLDFAGTLALSLHNMKTDNSSIPVYVGTKPDGFHKELKSSVTGDRVCFVHGGGDSFEALKGIAQELGMGGEAY